MTDESFQGGALMNGPDDERVPAEAGALFMAAVPRRRVSAPPLSRRFHFSGEIGAAFNTRA